MKIHKSIKLKIHPTVKQQKQLINHFGCARWIYNYFLQYKTDQYKKTKKSASWLEMNKLLTELKKQPDKQWLCRVSRRCLANSIANLDLAFNSFFQGKAKYPRFKNKHSKQSFRIDAPFGSIKPTGIHIPLVGMLRCKPELSEEYKLLSITVVKTPTNKYYISINIEIDIPNPIIDKSKPVIGIDFGLKTFITTSSGEKIDHPLPYKKSLRRLRRAQRKLSRRKKGSHRREMRRLRVALIHEKITNQRSDFLHKLSSRLVDENQAIYLEDLSLKGMKARWGRKVSDLGWRMFTDFLSYKGSWYGCLVEKRDRLFPSSRLCSVCGRINSMLTLSDRVWTCLGCGTIHDRDWNAAKNIRDYGPVTRKQRTGRVGVVEPLIELSRQE